MAVSLQNIQEKVNISKNYYQTLLDSYKASLIKGCDNIPANLNCLKWLIYALNADLRDVINTDKTQSLYVKLVTILGIYNVAFNPNANVVIPNTTYTIAATGKPPIFITDADFVGNTYTNTSLVGNNAFAVFNQNGNRYLINGVDFTYNAAGGLIIVAGIFGGESYVLIF